MHYVITRSAFEHPESFPDTVQSTTQLKQSWYLEQTPCCGSLGVATGRGCGPSRQNIGVQA
jgi:hypothetical protein